MPDLDIATAVAVDYGASVPVDEKAPIRITVQDDGTNTGTAKPPGLRLRDFKPSGAKARKIAKMKAERGEPSPPPQPHRRGIVVERDGTFISNKEMQKRKSKRNERIKTLARKLYREKKTEIVEYMQSLDITARATKQEKLKPKKRLRRALKIVKLGHPMTKADAMEQARGIVEKKLRRNKE